MRILLIVLALTLAAAAPTLAAAARSSNSDAVHPTAMSESSDIDACFACCLNVDQATLNRLRSQGWKTPDIVMAAVISMRSGVCIDDVLAQYKSCSNWRDVAKQYNLSVADVMKFRLTGDGNMEAFNTTLVMHCYSVAECDVAALRAKGMSWGEICMVANAAVRTGQTLMQIAELRGQGMTWEQIACKYNIAPSDITKPAGMRSVAMVTPTPAGSGPITASVSIRDDAGNIIMNEDMANRWYRRGYDWLDVAVATNIAKSVGYPVWELLILRDAGFTWYNIADRFGVCYTVAFNVCDWPFAQGTLGSQRTTAASVRRIAKYQVPLETVGAGPGGPRQMPYWLQENGTWFGNEWCTVCTRPCPPDPCPAPSPTCPTN